MAYIKLKRKSLSHNFDYLTEKLASKNIAWGVVSKILCGNKLYIQELLNLGVKEIHDARISNLQIIKELDPSIQTVYIKPPAKNAIQKIVRFADVSFNTELETIKCLSEEAKRQERKHKVIIMVEMGDLREGVLGDELLKFYEEVFELPNILITGIGTNLNCLHGVMPSQDKLIQLCLYKQLIELKFNRKIQWVSGGTSVVLPLLLSNQLPSGINHFRVGEMLYFGTNLFTNKLEKGLKDDVFTLYAQIIELTEKPKIPTGELAPNPSGEEFEIKEEDIGKKSFRAIIDLGLLDISPDYLIPVQKDIETIGASSDMIVIDLGNTRKNYKVGDWLKFKLKYMGALRLLNSNYIDKVVDDK